MHAKKLQRKRDIKQREKEMQEKVKDALAGGNRVTQSKVANEEEEDRVEVTQYMRVQDYFKDCHRIDKERISKSKREVRAKPKDWTPEEVQEDELIRAKQDAKAMRIRREKREKDFFAKGTPTEMAYFVAQALCQITAYFHPDPDNSPTVKGFIAEIETTDDVPVVTRARTFAEIQKAFLSAKTKELIRQGKLEKSTGDYTSSVVLVAY
jgi:hypothetical protein